MKTLGTTIKNAREARGISMEEMHERTRIALHVIQNIEKGERGDLPEVTFRAFIRTLADELDLNADGLLTDVFPKKTPPSPELGTEPEKSDEDEEISAMAQSFRGLSWLRNSWRWILPLGVGLAVVLLYLLNRHLFIEPDVKPADLSASFDTMGVQFTVRIQSARAMRFRAAPDTAGFTEWAITPDSAQVIHARDSLQIHARRWQHLQLWIDGESMSHRLSGGWKVSMNRDSILYKKRWAQPPPKPAPASQEKREEMPPQENPSQENSTQEAPVLTGLFTPDSLMRLLPLWDARRATMRPDADVLLEIEDARPQVTLVCFFGSWDGASGQVIPRLIRILNKVYLPNLNVSLIGVDRSLKDRGGMMSLHSVQGLPTLLFLQGGREMGRIVGQPAQPLETRMLEIFKQGADRE